MLLSPAYRCVLLSKRVLFFKKKIHISIQDIVFQFSKLLDVELPTAPHQSSDPSVSHRLFLSCPFTARPLLELPHMFYLPAFNHATDE